MAKGYEILPFTPVKNLRSYYQVLVGEYGVVMKDSFNPVTLEGIELVRGKATCFPQEDFKTVLKLGKSLNGEVKKIEETFERVVMAVDIKSFLAVEEVPGLS